MSKTKLSLALTDDEFERLDDFRKQFPEAMNLETMDGFFAALICAPEPVPMGKAFAQIWGEYGEFASYEEAQEISDLVVRHWNTIAKALNEDELYIPLLLQDEAGNRRANDWAQGFCRGMDFSIGGWDELLNDEADSGWIIPIFALAHEHDPDPEMRPGVIDEERREQMIAGLIAGLKKIHQYFAPHRRAAAQNSASKVHGTPRIGRNDPCPCGSGRKYKHCCAGKTPTVH